MDLSKIEFRLCSGGLELLCNSVKIHNVNIELQKAAEKVTVFFFCFFFSVNTEILICETDLYLGVYIIGLV